MNSVPHIHQWGFPRRESQWQCTKCGIKRKDWEKQMALTAVEYEIACERPEGYRITVAKNRDSTTHLTIKTPFGVVARVFLDDNERKELIEALMSMDRIRST
jgi:hypothetical protein